MFHLIDVNLTENTLPAIQIISAEAEINGLVMLGNHSGLDWDADHNQERNSVLSNALISGTDCLTLSNHDQIFGNNVTITNDCTGEIDFNSVKLN